MQLFHGLDSVQLEQLLDRHRETAHQRIHPRARTQGLPNGFVGHG